MMYDLTGVSPKWPAGLEPLWAACVQEAMLTANAWHGPGSRGEPELLTALGELLRVDPRRIVVTSGVRNVTVALGALSSGLLIEKPTFAQIPALFQSLGIPVRCAAWPDLAALGHRAGGTIWVTSPARNPDGASIEARLAMRLRDIAAERDGFMVVNETYAWYADFTAPPGCVRVGSLSKLVGGGARLGWVIDPPEAAASALARLGPPTAWQRAWARFFGRTGRERLIAAFVRPVQDARNAFFAASGDLADRLVHPGDGPSVLIPLGESVTEQRAAALLAERGILVGTGSDFLSGRPGIRIAFTGLTASQAEDAGQIVRTLLDENPWLLSRRP